jgi:hypothetical protein
MLTHLAKLSLLTVFLDFYIWALLRPTEDDVRPYFEGVAAIFPVLEKAIAKGNKVQVKVDEAEMLRPRKEHLSVGFWLGLFGRRQLKD